MTQMIGVVTITARDGEEDALQSLLEQMHAAAITDDGCELYSVFRPRRQERTFMIVEVYRDRDALVRHQSNQRLAELGASLAGLSEGMDVRLGPLVAGDATTRPSDPA